MIKDGVTEGEIDYRTERKSQAELVDEAMEEHLRKESLFEVDKNVAGLKFIDKVKILGSNWCFITLSMAGFFRFFGGYSLGFLSAEFFENRYPDYTSQYAVMGSVVVIGGGLPASMLGGWISDRYESRIGSIKGIIAGGGALLAIPFILIAYAWQPSFWGSIIAYYFAYFIAEMWYGPSHAQINNMFPSEF